MPTDITPVFIIGTLIYAFTNAFRSATSKDWSQVENQVFAWVVGIVIVIILAGTSVGEHYVIPGTGVQMGSYSAWDKIVYGMLLTSVFSPIVKLYQAVDRSQSAKVGPINPARKDTPPEV